MINLYTLKVTLRSPIEIFEAPEGYSLKNLLDHVGVQKGEGSSNPLLSSSVLPEHGNEMHPNNLLLLPQSRGGRRYTLLPVGACSMPWGNAGHTDFALCSAYPDLIARVPEIAEHVMEFEATDLNKGADAYLRNVAERVERRSE